jgi:hypothetical protein
LERGLFDLQRFDRQLTHQRRLRRGCGATALCCAGGDRHTDGYVCGE